MREIVTTHNNTDFDALASAAAATFLYPGSVLVLPGKQNPNVREFLFIHRDLIRAVERSRADFSQASRLIVTDTGSWSRLDRFDELRNKDGLDIHVWDHHMAGGDIAASWTLRKETGAAVTLLVAEMARRDIPVAPMHATLFLLGIHEDTGSLTFPSTRPEDVRACAYLLENGADLNVAGAFLSQSFDAMHQELLTRMLADGRSITCDGYTVGITVEPAEKRLTMLAPVVARYLTIVKADAVFSVFAMDSDKSMVIARGGYSGLDVGRVVAALGGGGHPSAGSAMVRGMKPEAVAERIARLLSEGAGKELRVSAIMISAAHAICASTPIADARKIFSEARAKALLVVKENRPTGLVVPADMAKTQNDSLPVSSVMRQNLPAVCPEDGLRTVTRLMMEHDIPLVPVLDKQSGALAGIVTRADVLLQMYSL
ncbi:MAG: CBS domain-containing protein [Thermodesulfobacteriota bacterium]